MKTKSVTIPVILALAVIVAACSGDSGGGSDTTETDNGGADAPSNACPPEGCEITIQDVSGADDELSITWEANFDPELSRNHIHVYWDTYTADEVSSDAEDRGVEQGDWHPTDAYPTYTTESGASLANHGESTTICVTAANRDHVVLDSSIVDCRDVGDLIG